MIRGWFSVRNTAPGAPTYMEGPGVKVSSFYLVQLFTFVPVWVVILFHV